MSLNWKEINLVLSELGLPGAQIQKVWQGAFDVLHLELYGKIPGAEKPGRRLLLIALTPGACRLHETWRDPVRPEKPLRFAEFCKSRLVNGYVEEARQIGEDRIVQLTVRRGEQRYCFLARLWSNAANIIVTDEAGTILDVMRRLPKRGEITGGRYPPESPPAPADPDGNIPDAEITRKEIPREKIRRDYEVRELPGPGSFNARLDAWYAEHGGGLSLDALREEARRFYRNRIGRLETSLEKLRAREADYAASERLREYGDIIMANLGNIRAGDEWLEAENFYGGGTIRIKLDPKKKPTLQGEEYYARYRKAKSGLEDLGREIAEETAELARLEALLESLLAETNPLVLHQRLKKRNRAAGGPKTGKKQRPGLAFRRGDWLILVGRDAAENDALLRRHVRGLDLWLHVRDYGGSYVFIRSRSGKTVPLDILLDAGNLALFYSKARNNAEGDLFYTQVKYLRRAKNGPRGLVIPTQEKNLHVRTDPARLRELERCRVTE